MISKEILKQIRRIQITTGRMVSDVFAGQYQSVFKGRGMEFSEVREYQPGDEIRSIDWNVTARMGRPFVKKFVEERELTVMLLLDLSRSGDFGTVQKLKRALAAEICSLLALSAVRNNDKAGLITFTGRIEKSVPPRKGLSHALRIVREALYSVAQDKNTDIAGALEYLAKVCPRRAVVFLISDLYDDDFFKALTIVNKRHDITAITITDPRELDLPDIGLVRCDDPESGQSFLLDTGDKALRDEFGARGRRRVEERKKQLRRANVGHIDIYSDAPYAPVLFRFFRARERMMR